MIDHCDKKFKKSTINTKKIAKKVFASSYNLLVKFFRLFRIFPWKCLKKFWKKNSIRKISGSKIATAGVWIVIKNFPLANWFNFLVQFFTCLWVRFHKQRSKYQTHNTGANINKAKKRINTTTLSHFTDPFHWEYVIRFTRLLILRGVCTSDFLPILFIHCVQIIPISAQSTE